MGRVNKMKLNLTGVLIKKKDSKGYTSYMAEMPEVIAEGKTEKEAIKNLFDAFKFIMEYKKEQEVRRNLEGFDVIERNFELELI